MSGQTLALTLKIAVQHLAEKGVANPQLDARLLLEAATGFSRTEMLLKGDEPIDATALIIYENLLQRRAQREPVARILGQREFWGLPFQLGPGTLEPRPDSETLIEAALELGLDAAAPLEILDLGTGTGCLLAALLHEFKQAQGTAVDLNPAALEVAKANFAALDFSERVKLHHGSWAEGLVSPFHLIISNPPYIGENEELEPEVAQHDPALALFAGADGLSAYRALIPQLPTILAPGGAVILELGIRQSEAVISIAKEAGFAVKQLKNDLNGIPRALVLEQPK